MKAYVKDPLNKDASNDINRGLASAGRSFCRLRTLAEDVDHTGSKGLQLYKRVLKRNMDQNKGTDLRLPPSQRHHQSQNQLITASTDPALQTPDHKTTRLIRPYPVWHCALCDD